MTGRDLYEGLGRIDQALIDEAAETPARHRRILRRTLLAAACLCVLLAVSAGAAEMLWGVSVRDIVVGKEESSYRILGEVEPVPRDVFSPRMDEVLQEIQKQWENYQLYDSWYPGHWRTDFDTWGECEEFLGFSLKNPLEELDCLEAGDHSGLPMEWELLDGRGRHCQLNLIGTGQGLSQGWIATGYTAGDIWMSLTVHFYTDREQVETGSAWAEQVDFSWETYPMSNGQAAVVMAAEPQRETGAYTALDAYFVQGYGLYTLHAVAPTGTGGEPAARQALELALNCF